jgi:hypothetical protein
MPNARGGVAVPANDPVVELVPGGALNMQPAL